MSFPLVVDQRRQMSHLVIARLWQTVFPFGSSPTLAHHPLRSSQALANLCNCVTTSIGVSE